MRSLSSRKFYVLSAIIFMLMISTGCVPHQIMGDADVDVYQKLHKKYSNMASYTATVQFTVKSNKTDNTYLVHQKVKKPDLALFSIAEPEELAGLVTVYNGHQVILHSGDEEPLSLTASHVMDDTFLHNFFSLYYQSEETVVSTQGGERDGSAILLKTMAVPTDAERHAISLLLDAKTLEPKMLTVYDVGGNIRMIAEFLEFCYNPPIEDEVFTREIQIETRKG